MPLGKNGAPQKAIRTDRRISAPIGMGNIPRNVASGSKASSGRNAAETRNYTVTLNLNGKGAPVKATDQASVDSLLGVLEEMQRATR